MEIKTVIIIEHRLEDAMHMGADRIILMENGKIISDSTPEELFLSDKLIHAGIREPLYLTALKYAGIDRDVMIVGRAGQAEIWDQKEFAAFEAENLTPEKLLQSLEAIGL